MPRCRIIQFILVIIYSFIPLSLLFLRGALYTAHMLHDACLCLLTRLDSFDSTRGDSSKLRRSHTVHPQPLDHSTIPVDCRLSEFPARLKWCEHCVPNSKAWGGRKESGCLGAPGVNWVTQTKPQHRHHRRLQEVERWKRTRTARAVLVGSVLGEIRRRN